MGRGDDRDPLFVGSVAKGLSVLQAFRESSRELSLTEIAERAQLSRSAAQRACHTLILLGFLEKDVRSRHVRLSPRVLDTAYAFLSSDPLVAIASRFVVDAHEKHGHAFNLGRPIDFDIMYVVRLPSLRSAITSPLVGGRAPLYCTASGRSYLSTLPDGEAEAMLDQMTLAALTPHTITNKQDLLDRLGQIRERGYETADQECMAGEVTVAAPVIGRGRRGVGAVNLCVTRQYWTPERAAQELSPIITQLANEISRAVGANASA